MSLWPNFRHWLHQTLPLWEYVRNVDLVSAKQKDRYVVASITVCRANLSTDVPSKQSSYCGQVYPRSIYNAASKVCLIKLIISSEWAFILSSVSSSGHMLDVGKVITYHSAVQRTYICLEAMFGASYRCPHVRRGFDSVIMSASSSATTYMFTYYLCTALLRIYCSFIYFLTNGLIHSFMCIFYNLAIVSKWEESIATDSMLKWCLRTWSKGQGITLEIQTW